MTAGTAEARVKTGSQTAVIAAGADLRQSVPASSRRCCATGRTRNKRLLGTKKLVETGGWAMPGSTEVPSGLAQACAD